ncbi:hypothetical protein OG978_32525 [Streptomyces sp. NBC_01591]|uniref:hypothetical protein n=1 Tax=Streptomyces sp. NBC_01591 TaxID=2975888 RepID=UPI002DDB01E2|nr:hypothetical protein [Streptomyces sp. NBC_01591]WSD71700.1 hypothetical protein OG978_32525 [Streptomyces sp. NBC_01591]
MSIYSTLPGISGQDPEGAPWIYRGSHIPPANTDPRGGSVTLAEIPSHITRDGHDDQDEDGLPWPWLRLALEDLPAETPAVLINPDQARRLADSLTHWACWADGLVYTAKEREGPVRICAARGTQEDGRRTSLCVLRQRHRGRIHRGGDGVQWPISAEATDQPDSTGETSTGCALPPRTPGGLGARTCPDTPDTRTGEAADTSPTRADAVGAAIGRAFDLPRPT